MKIRRELNAFKMFSLPEESRRQWLAACMVLKHKITTLKNESPTAECNSHRLVKLDP